MDSNLRKAQDKPAFGGAGTGHARTGSVAAAFDAEAPSVPAKRLRSQSGLSQVVDKDHDLESVTVRQDAAKAAYAVPKAKRGRPFTKKFRKTDMVHCQLTDCTCLKRRMQYRRMTRP